MSYIYVVTRIVKGHTPGLTEIPNLGAYTSFKRAEQHFNSVYKSRTERGSATMITYNKEFFYKDDRYIVMMSAMTNEGEELRLEKWRVMK